MSEESVDYSIRTCVFCGNRPVNKTAEHVIPRWLISATGTKDLKRPMVIPDQDSGDMRVIAFDQFRFPACEECNTRFSVLEEEAKGVVLSLLERAPINRVQANVLLDWMDKIRVGLWLGGLMMGKNRLGIRPHFAIEQRLAKHDRIVFLAHTEDSTARLTYHNVFDPVFQLVPSFTFLLINHLALVSFSAMGVVCSVLGLPSPRPEHNIHLPDGRVMLECSLQQTEPSQALPLTPGFSAIAQPICDDILPHVEQEQRDEMISLNRSVNLWRNGKRAVLDDRPMRVLTSPIRHRRAFWRRTTACCLGLRALLSKDLIDDPKGTTSHMICLIKAMESQCPGSSLVCSSYIEPLSLAFSAMCGAADRAEYEQPEFVNEFLSDLLGDWKKMANDSLEYLTSGKIPPPIKALLDHHNLNRRRKR